jgi:hypothetical protein
VIGEAIACGSAAECSARPASWRERNVRNRNAAIRAHSVAAPLRRAGRYARPHHRVHARASNAGLSSTRRSRGTRPGRRFIRRRYKPKPRLSPLLAGEVEINLLQRICVRR